MRGEVQESAGLKHSILYDSDIAALLNNEQTSASVTGMGDVRRLGKACDR
jgi:hypothetical protein